MRSQVAYSRTDIVTKTQLVELKVYFLKWILGVVAGVGAAFNAIVIVGTMLALTKMLGH